MTEVYIALGSNLGDRLKNLENAVRVLSDKIEDIKVSFFYETEAIGMESGHSHPFLNGVIVGKTNLNPFELMQFLLKTENDSGRIRSSHKGHVSRVIDLDLLIYGDVILKEKELEIPHPRMHQRLFVLKPMMDINPAFEIPGIKKTVNELYQKLLTEG
jgi:2-amino-4-hydroxy-6-hydroxymethyldihydropteridine diphosphokinase